jgi:osmotically-inducible protein OsmY
MKINHSYKTILVSLMLVSGLVACDKPGPAETAGKKIDQTTENVSNAVSNAVDKVDASVTKNSNTTARVFDDAEITAKVKAAFLNEPGMKSMKIAVATDRGVVTLSGSIDNQMNKDKAIKLAESVEGVKSVNNQLMMNK